MHCNRAYGSRGLEVWFPFVAEGALSAAKLMPRNRSLEFNPEVRLCEYATWCECGHANEFSATLMFVACVCMHCVCMHVCIV